MDLVLPVQICEKCFKYSMNVGSTFTAVLEKSTLNNSDI